MSVRTRTILTVTAGFLLVSFAIWALDQWIVQPAFVELERAQALEDATRARAVVASELRQLDLKLGDWADWDDSYAFAESRDPAFVQSNLGDWTILEGNTQLNLAAIFDRGGRRLYSGGYDSDLGGEVLPAAFDGDRPAVWEALAPTVDAEEGRTGLLRTEQGLLMLAARPLRTTQGQGPSRGVLVFGRFLDEPMRALLVEQTQVGWDLYLDGDPRLSAAERALWATLPHEGAVLRPGGDATPFVYELLSDLAGAPVALLRTPIRKEISTTARQTSWTLTGALGLAALVLILMGASLSVRFRGETRGPSSDALVWSTATLVLLIGFTLSAGLFVELNQTAEALPQKLLFPLIGVVVTLLLARHLFILGSKERQTEALMAERTAELVRRDELLQATSDALAALLSGRDLNQGIAPALALLGRAVKADRAYIFENHPHPRTGAPLMSHRQEWCAPGITAQRDNPALHDLPYADWIPGWYPALPPGPRSKAWCGTSPPPRGRSSSRRASAPCWCCRSSWTSASGASSASTTATASAPGAGSRRASCVRRGSPSARPTSVSGPRRRGATARNASATFRRWPPTGSGSRIGSSDSPTSRWTMPRQAWPAAAPTRAS